MRILVWICLSGFVKANLDLIYVINVWRHGDRAPARLFSSVQSESSPIFSNGLGQLTEQGIAHAYQMGEFLRRRYVDSRFITSPNQVRIRSTIHDRTQRTAREAVRAMFGSEEAVELEVEPDVDWMLKPNFMQCPVLQAIQEAKCPGNVEFPKDYAKNFDSYEFDLWRCMGLDEHSKYFGPSKDGFRLMESVLNEYFNNYSFEGSNITKGHIEEADEMYRAVQRITVGVGSYHEPDMLRVYSGELLHEIMTKMYSRTECHAEGSCDGERFQGYSSQDLQILPLLEILNSTEPAVGDGAPLYTAGLFLELYAAEPDAFYVKGFYRQDSGDRVVDLTSNFPGCQGLRFCPFESFRAGSMPYEHASNEMACQEVERIQNRLETIREGTRNGKVEADQAEKSVASSASLRFASLVATQLLFSFVLRQIPYIQLLA